MKTIKSLSAVTSVAKGIFLVLLLTSSSSFAIIGAPVEANKYIYGNSIRATEVKDGSWSEVYAVNDLIVTTQYILKPGGGGSKAVEEAYVKENHSSFTKNEIAHLLDISKMIAKAKCSWKCVIDSPSDNSVYVLLSEDSPYVNMTASQMTYQMRIDVIFHNPSTAAVAMLSKVDDIPTLTFKLTPIK